MKTTVKQNPPDFPTGLALIQNPPKGYKWIYRGVGYNSNGRKCLYSIYSTEDGEPWTSVENPQDCGGYPYHYAELVEDDDSDVFTLEYQSKLAAEWILNPFSREGWSGNHWRKAGGPTWTRGVIYRRKILTQQEVDEAEFQKAISKTTHSRELWQSALEYARNGK